MEPEIPTKLLPANSRKQRPNRIAQTTFYTKGTQALAVPPYSMFAPPGSLEGLIAWIADARSAVAEPWESSPHQDSNAS